MNAKVKRYAIGALKIVGYALAGLAAGAVAVAIALYMLDALLRAVGLSW